MDNVNNSTNKIEIVDFDSLDLNGMLDAYSYMMLSEYELLKLHTENGVSSDEYGVNSKNLGRFVAGINEYYHNEDINGYLCIDHGLFIGMIVIRKDPVKGMYIVSLYVDEAFRRQGIATKLVDYILNKTEEDKATALIGTFNNASLGLFTKLGFKELGDSEIKLMKEYQLVLGGK